MNFRHLSHLRSALALLVTLTLLSGTGCGSSKEPAYFALQPRAGSRKAGAPPLVELRRPSVAGYLDRSDIVTRVSDYQLRIDTTERWAEPLGEMISRVLASDLSTRLSESHVFMESGAISTPPDATVAVDILGFNAAADDQVSLIAQVAVETTGPSHNATVKTFTLTRKLSNARSTPSLVEAMSALLADLSDAIADILRQPDSTRAASSR